MGISSNLKFSKRLSTDPGTEDSGHALPALLSQGDLSTLLRCFTGVTGGERLLGLLDRSMVLDLELTDCLCTNVLDPKSQMAEAPKVTTEIPAFCQLHQLQTDDHLNDLVTDA